MTKIPSKVHLKPSESAFYNLATLESKLNEYHDYLAEREEAEHYEKLPNLAPLFKVEDVKIHYLDRSYRVVIDCGSEQNAEQAREALLKLTDTH